MKQIDECLDRFFDGRPRLKKKYQAVEHENCLYLFHYQHLVLVFHLHTYEFLHEWWELPTDKRGLDAAKAYLTKRFHL